MKSVELKVMCFIQFLIENDRILVIGESEDELLCIRIYFFWVK